MSLRDITNLIRHYCNSTKSGFLKVCALLYEVNKKEYYKELYPTFEDYILTEGFEFGVRHAYNYIKIWETFGDTLYSDYRDTKLLKNLSITHLMQIANVKDKEIREEITERALKKKLTIEQLDAELKALERRTCDPDKPPVADTNEERYYKIKNDGMRLKNEINTLFACFEDFKIRFNRWKEISSKFNEFKWVEEDIQEVLGKW